MVEEKRNQVPLGYSNKPQVLVVNNASRSSSDREGFLGRPFRGFGSHKKIKHRWCKLKNWHREGSVNYFKKSRMTENRINFCECSSSSWTRGRVAFNLSFCPHSTLTFILALATTHRKRGILEEETPKNRNAGHLQCTFELCVAGYLPSVWCWFMVTRAITSGPIAAAKYRMLPFIRHKITALLGNTLMLAIHKFATAILYVNCVIFSETSIVHIISRIEHSGWNHNSIIPEASLDQLQWRLITDGIDW